MPGRSMFGALRHRNFRLFFAGQALSLIGTWAQSTAMPWLVARLTGSPLLAGAAAFWSQLPCLILAPFAGAVTDHVNRHRLLMIAQTLAMAQATALAVLVGSGVVQVWHVILLNGILSAVNAFEMTARQTFLGEMLDDRADLANAIALNSSMVHGARLFGASLAAILIGWLGEAACFGVNAVSFLAVLVMLFLMRLPPATIQRRTQPVLTILREGFDYVAHTPAVREPILVLATISLCALPYLTILVPFFARDLFESDPRIYGMLMTAPGAGAFCAGLTLAWLGLFGVRWRICVAPIVGGICLCGLSMKPGLAMSLLFLFGTGYAFLTMLNSCNMMMQSVVPDDKRGRVMSFYTIAFLGVTPLGSQFVGWVAEKFHVEGAFAFCGLICIATGVIAAIRARGWKKSMVPPPVPSQLLIDEAVKQGL